MKLGKFELALNPVLARESRVRMRGWRAPALITLYVGILGAVVLLILWIASIEQNLAFAPELGGVIYSFLAFAQFALLCFSAPGLTAGAIAGERERQTLDLLLVTRMSPLQVAVGKLGAALGFTLLLMFASLPVYGVLFLFGGIALKNLLLTAVAYVMTVLLMGSVGLYFSAVFKRTQAAVVAAYGVCLGWMVAFFVATILVMEVFPRGTPAPDWGVFLGYVNPVFGLAAAAGGPIFEITGLFNDVLQTAEARESIWWKFSLFSLAVSTLLIGLTARRIAPFKE